MSNVEDLYRFADIIGYDNFEIVDSLPDKPLDGVMFYCFNEKFYHFVNGKWEEIKNISEAPRELGL